MKGQYGNCKMSDKNDDVDKCFEELLNKAIAGAMSPQAEEEFQDEYLYQIDEAKAFKYLKTATERGYAPAYHELGKSYLLGKGCDESVEQALHYLNLALANGYEGDLELGDCYRLGLGVTRDFETAWKHYSKAIEERGATNETIDDLRLNYLMLRESFDIDVSCPNVPAEWWEFAMAKTGEPSAFFARMTVLYENNSERWLCWVQKAAEAGTVWCMKEMLDRIQDDVKRENYAAAILSADYAENDWVIEETALDVLAGKYPDALKKQAASILFYNDLMTPADRENKSFIDILEAALREEDDADDSDEYDEETIVCPSCHQRIRVDEIDDPDLQGDICNDCYYTGKCLEPDEQ